MAPSHSRCFTLNAADVVAPVPCKWKAETKKHGPQVALMDTFVDVRHAATIALDEWSMELYQINELTSTTDLAHVFNIPLVSEILVYPVIMRISGTHEVPSLGRVKRFLCEHLIQNADQSFFPDDEEIEEDVELPSLSEEDPTELPEEEDDHSLSEDSDVLEEDDEVMEHDDDEEDDEPDALDDDD